MSNVETHSRKRVLIVSDSADDRWLIAACVRAVTDVEVAEAGDGWAALRMIRNRSPDLIVLDMDLPGFDGYLITRFIRTWGGRFTTLPIFALTSDSGPGVRARCLSAGAGDSMAKSLIDPSEFGFKVCATLRRDDVDTRVPADTMELERMG